jgi:hypothetical protein
MLIYIELGLIFKARDMSLGISIEELMRFVPKNTLKIIN